MDKIRDEHKSVFDIRKFKFDKNKRIDLHQFTHIRGYHGCRVHDEESYRKNGLHCFTYEEAWNQCRKVFERVVAVDALKQVFDENWNEWYTNGAINGVYFFLSREGFKKGCGHYVVYGSEFLQAIAVSIERSYFSGKFTDYKEMLKNFGNPMVITCDVPTTDIDPSFLDSIECSLNDEDDEDDEDITTLAFLVKQVDPENIVSICPYKG